MFNLLFALIFTDQGHRHILKSYKHMFVVIEVIVYYWLNFGKQKNTETNKTPSITSLF